MQEVSSHIPILFNLMNEPESVSHSYELLSSTLGHGTANAWGADLHFRECLQKQDELRFEDFFEILTEKFKNLKTKFSRFEDHLKNHPPI